MNRYGFRGISRLAALISVLIVAMTATGCKSIPPPDPAIFNKKRPVLTDAFSRKMAKESQKDSELLSQDYVLGAGDSLEIGIFGWELKGETRSASFTISESGLISLPTIGEIAAGGQTVDAVKKAIETKLKSDGLMVKPRVTATISEYYSKRVAIVGAVGEPGIYTLRRNATTLVEILSLAGGVNGRAGQSLHVIRHMPSVKPGKPGVTLRLRIGLPDLFEDGDSDVNMIIKHGDTIIVPAAENYSVLGQITSPGSYPLTRPITLLDGIAQAGGLNNEATEKNCYIMRLNQGGTPVRSRFNYDDIIIGTLPNPYLREGDVITIDPEGRQALGWRIWGVITGIVSFGYNLND